MCACVRLLECVCVPRTCMCMHTCEHASVCVFVCVCVCVYVCVCLCLFLLNQNQIKLNQNRSLISPVDKVQQVVRTHEEKESNLKYFGILG